MSHQFLSYDPVHELHYYPRGMNLDEIGVVTQIYPIVRVVDTGCTSEVNTALFVVGTTMTRRRGVEFNESRFIHIPVGDCLLMTQEEGMWVELRFRFFYAGNDPAILGFLNHGFTFEEAQDPDAVNKKLSRIRAADDPSAIEIDPEDSYRLTPEKEGLIRAPADPC